MSRIATTIIIISALAGIIFSIFLLREEIARTHPQASFVLIVQDTKKTSQGGSGKIIFLTMDADMDEAMAHKLAQHEVSAYYDPRIFAYLEQRRVPTTFFVSGLFAQTYPDLMQSLASQSFFSFQNHSYDESGFTPHCYWLRALNSPQEKIGQIEKTQRVLKTLTGQTPRYFRYPGLCRGAGDDDLVKSLGLQINEGDISAADPFNPHTDRIVQYVLAHLKDGGIIIMHVGGPDAPASYDVLRQIVPAIQKEGFTFEKLL